MNPLKFGESFCHGNAEPSLSNKEGVETRRAASRTDEGIVQTTNMLMVAKAIVVRKSLGFEPCGFDSRSRDQIL